MGKTELAMIEGFRCERGLLWPAYDTRCAEVTFHETAENMALIRENVPAQRRRVAVQAGGNCGQLVRPLAAAFEVVHTFEPDPRNFLALTFNTAEYHNVFRFQAALDQTAGYAVSLANGDDRYPDSNCGALYVASAGNIPVMKLDSLELPICDLIMLDVEGSEARALDGAYGTIRRCQPVIIFENKGHGAKFYGEHPNAAEHWLIDHCNYRVIERGRLDTVMVSAG